MSDARVELVRSLIRDVPDFPKPGIVFKDITPLLADPKGFAACIDLFAERYGSPVPEAIVGIESRGFIFGAPLATRMGVPFVPARKPGKLPWKTVRAEYELEYGTDAVELHEDAVASGAKVLLVDDLIATGGTAAATIELIGKLGGEVLGAAFVIELGFLEGAKKLAPVEPYAILKY